MGTDSRMGSGHKKPMTKRHITIVGMGPSAVERKVDIAKYCDTPEVWCLNNGYHNYRHVLPMFTRWFELHSWDYLKEWSENESGAKAIGAKDHFDALNKLGCQVFCSEPLPEIKKQHVIDWSVVFAALQEPGDGKFGANYFLGSPSIMVALACWEHDNGQEVAEIRTWGIDTSDPSHAQQRQSWSYWCAQAHARGIEMTGTALAFMTEPEKDAGLIGLREMIGDQIEAKRQAPGSKDYVIAAHYTDNEPYRSHANRLVEQGRALGVDVWVRKLPACEYGDGVALNRREVFNTVDIALMENKRPVIYMDVDDELTGVPTLPEGFDGVGVIDNPELQSINSRLPVGSFFAVSPTDKGRAALDMVRPIAIQISNHRAINALWSSCQRWKDMGVVNITKHFRGCFRITPNRNRKKVCYT